MWLRSFSTKSYLYTLPYAFERFEFSQPNRWWSKSTCPNSRIYWSYDHCLKNDLLLSPIRFPNIHHMEIILPLNKKFQFVISILNHLISLNVRLSRENIQYQLNQLHLRLYLLMINCWHLVELADSKLTSISIRRLIRSNPFSCNYLRKIQVPRD